MKGIVINMVSPIVKGMNFNVQLLESRLNLKFDLLVKVDKLLSDTEDDMIIISDSAYRSLVNFEDEVLNDIINLIDDIREEKKI